MGQNLPSPDFLTGPHRLLLSPPSLRITGRWDEGDILVWSEVSSPKPFKPQGSDKAWAMPGGPSLPISCRQDG